MHKKNPIIGFDAKRIVCNGTGLGNYGRNLVNALTSTDGCPSLVLYAPDEGRVDLRSQLNPSPHIRFAYSGHSLRILQDWWRHTGIIADMQRDGIGLYHGLTGELPNGIRKTGIRTLLTIHDLIFMRHPEYYNRIDVQIYKHKFYRSIREADRIVAISECTKNDIIHYSDFPADRIDVVYQGCGNAFSVIEKPHRIEAIRQKYGLPERYILSVGSIEERKNIMLAIRALELLPEEAGLVVVGRRTPYTDKVMAFARQHNLSHRIMILHGIPNSDLPAIYQGAEVFVYPSRYEGFGIPIIEAIQSRLPVVAATGSCLEEAGGPDCLYVHPDDAEAMARAIGTFLSDKTLCKQSVERSTDYIRRFENQDIARAMLDEYAKLTDE